MKTPFFTLSLFVLFSSPFLTTAQSTQGAHPSAALELRSTTQGFLPPRLDTAQRDAIQKPAKGLLIYNTEKKSLETYDGPAYGWVTLATASSTIAAIFDQNNTTGIRLDDTPDNDVILFKVNGTESMRITASGTLYIKEALKDAIGSPGTAGQYLSSTASSTRWVDNDFFDADHNTGIRLDQTPNDDVIRFETAGAERMSINASGTVQIKDALNDAASVSGTLGQVLSSTGTSTRWVDDGIQFKTNAEFSALTPANLSAGDRVINTTSNTLNIRSQDNTDWYVYRVNNKIYHPDPQSPHKIREYGTIVSHQTGRIWLDRNIGADSRTSSSTYATVGTWNNSYGLVFRWDDVTTGDFRNDGPNPICPSGFRLPKKAEWCEEAANGTLGSVTCPDDGIGAISNGATAFYHLLLPMAGYKPNTATTSGEADAGAKVLGAYGGYWSSDASVNLGQNLRFNSSNAYMNTSNKSHGLSIRCIKKD